MRNVTKLACWPELQALGFTRINYRAHGRLVSVGAALQRELTSIDGRKFKTDIICIQPGNYSDKPYHITGEVSKPYYDTFKLIEFGKTTEIVMQVTRVNEFFSAAQILPTVKKMMQQ